MKERIKREFLEIKILLRSVPGLLLALFIVSVVGMNLLASKNIELPFDWLGLECGTLLSWVSFLTMDMMTKHYGPKASTQISIVALLVNLLVSLIFILATLIPGSWAAADVPGHESEINTAINSIFGSTWYVLVGSTSAFLISAVVNNFSNYGLSKIIRKDNFGGYVFRSYISTAIGQFVDNLVFNSIVSIPFFGWSFLQVVTCALFGMFCELIFEVIFSPLGYRITKRWKADGVGQEYLDFIEQNKIQKVEEAKAE